MSKPSIFEMGMSPNAANFVAQTPMTFIERTAQVYPDLPAIVHGALRQTWGETYKRCCQMAHALQSIGVGRGDTVAVMLPNIPAMVEAHFAVPMSGAVLNCLNTRLDAASIAFMLDHGEAKVIIVDREFAPTIEHALRLTSTQPIVIDVDDPEYTGSNACIGTHDYETLLRTGDPEFTGVMPEDEWDAICLNYTSGTTGNPKGVVFHHRGAYLNAISNILEWDMPRHPVYLWTLPIFHCNGWCFPWTIAARAGVNVCLRGVDVQVIFDAIRRERVTHYCGAPIVQQMLINAPAAMKTDINHTVKAMVAGAAPPAATIQGMEEMGFELTHTYGLTEIYGPATVCVQRPEWMELSLEERAALNARQGVRYHLHHAATVMDPATMTEVPRDGVTMGEVMFRGNPVMKGYLKNPTATEAVFAGGWFHTGDLAVLHADGYIKIKDRSKDIIISGGENISSIEIEDVLYRHPAVLACAVVAQPHEKWGETPCAFIELKADAQVSEQDIIAYCKSQLAGFKVPRAVAFGELPKTSTGKIQKFELRARAGSVAAIDV